MSNITRILTMEMHEKQKSQLKTVKIQINVCHDVLVAATKCG